MAPSKRKQSDEEDFVYTISDTEEVPADETNPDANVSNGDKDDGPPKKKAKKSKKSKLQDHEDDDRAGPWGKNDEDDGAMDPEFKKMFMNGGDEEEVTGLDDWGFGKAKGVSEKRVVDVDEIIERRREREKVGKGKKKEKEEEILGEGEDENEDDGDDDVELDHDDDEDGVLAEDGFGMGDVSDEDGDGSEASVADDMDVDHMEDQDDDDDEDGDSSSSSSSGSEEDPEEAAKRTAFFAPEEPTTIGARTKKTSKTTFQNMSLSRPILRGIAAVGWSVPSTVQAKAIPIALAGKDVVGGAETGSGKTGAFIIPVLERLLYRPKKVPMTRVVIMTPTRELAIQIHAVATKLASYTDIKFCLAVGGLSLKVQEAELRLRPDVVIATPGRFIDHMRNSAGFSVDQVEIFVLDEADRMLEDGFEDELKEVLTSLPKARQTMLFSATMTGSVDSLIRVGLNKPVRLMVDAQKQTVKGLVQKLLRLRPGREEKRLGYLVHLCKTEYTDRVIVFFREKKEAHRARIVFALLGLKCVELHGSMNQTQRLDSMEKFRTNQTPFLLATDLASRGIDIRGVDTVINHDCPTSLETYLHRVGRTARAGRSGTAITLAAEPERKVVRAAVKQAKKQGAKITCLSVPADEADKWQDQIDQLEDEIDAVLQEEKEEKQLANVEMQIKKGENMVVHQEEIKGRPRRTWFESERDKMKAKEKGRMAGKEGKTEEIREGLKKKGGGRLSGKARKKLDLREEGAGKVWKKGAAERAGKGAVLNFKKDGKKKGAGGGKVKMGMKGKVKGKR